MNSDDKFWSVFWLCVLGAVCAVVVYNIHLNRTYLRGGYCAQRVAGMSQGDVTWSKPPACGLVKP